MERYVIQKVPCLNIYFVLKMVLWLYHVNVVNVDHFYFDIFWDNWDCLYVKQKKNLTSNK